MISALVVSNADLIKWLSCLNKRRQSTSVVVHVVYVIISTKSAVMSELDIRCIKALGLLSVGKEKNTEIVKLLSWAGTLYYIIFNNLSDTWDQAPISTHNFCNSRDQLSVMNGMICKGMRIVIPPCLRPQLIQLIQKSQFGKFKWN